MRHPLRKLHQLRFAIAAVLASSAAAHAQSVRGTVVDAAGTPVPGVLIELLDSASAIRARALSDAFGRFFVATPQAGTYRVRTLRIGFRPALSGTIALAAGVEATQQFTLTGLPSRLDTVRVGGSNVCGRTSSVAAAAVVWEQARAAINAAEVSAIGRNVTATRVSFDRRMDNAGFRTLEQHIGVSTDLLTQPWPAPTPASLHGAGYILVGEDSITYRAPGLDMLGSTTFIDDHCFRVVRGRDRKTIGVAFEPVPGRRALADIRGTVWVDTATSQLSGMDFHYVFRDNQDLEVGAGGKMEFARLANGAWAISIWEIRMPVLEQRGPGSVTGVRGGAGLRVVTTAVRVTGGQLALALGAGDTLWSRPPIALRGEVHDSLTGRGVEDATVRLAGTAQTGTTDRNGRFTIAGILPGEYYLDVRTPSLDSLGTSSQLPVSITDGSEAVTVRVPTAALIVASMCPGNRPAGGEIPGILLGSVATRDGSPVPAETQVTAEWKDPGTGSLRRAELHADSTGSFRLCNVPKRVAITLGAAADNVAAEPFTFALAPEQPVAHAQMVLDRPAAATAVFTGIVTDSAKRPVAAAEVFLPDVSLTTQTDARGEFTIRGILPGPQRVMVRKIGYGPLDVQLVFKRNEALSRTVVLTRMTVLNEVQVTATIRDPRMEQFEENRKLGLGHFMTRDYLKTQEGRPTSSVFAGIPGVAFDPHRHANDKGGAAKYISSSRKCRPRLEFFASGMVERCDPCYALVFLDGMLMNPRILFDINEIPVEDIEAIEYYASPSEVPGRYQGFDIECGVVLIHTIRDKGGAKPRGP